MLAVTFVVGGALFVVFQRRAKGLVSTLTAAVPQIEAAYRAAPLPGESPPRILSAYIGSGAFRKVVMLGATEKRVFVGGRSPTPQALPLDGARISLREKTFADTGNTHTVFTKGWEASVTPAAGETHTWRLHTMNGTPEERRSLQFLLTQLGSRAG